MANMVESSLSLHSNMSIMTVGSKPAGQSASATGAGGNAPVAGVSAPTYSDRPRWLGAARL
jgi:hypothetical protein